MNILIAPDSFKESLQAMEVCDAIKAGVSQVFPNANYTFLPLADGGEGTSEVLSYVLDGHWQQVEVHDPLMRPIIGRYLLTANKLAVIEIAEACGLHLLTLEERNPLIATSYGVGEMIADAIDKGATQILIGLGGSATNDAGAGMLQALGAQLLDKQHQQIAPGGAHLIELHHIDTQAVSDKLASIDIQVACDVTSPLIGPTGASHIFAPQKGASEADVEQLEIALNHFGQFSQQLAIDENIDGSIDRSIDGNIDDWTDGCSENDCREETSNHHIHKYQDKMQSHLLAGAGAAGGLGFALMRYCEASLNSGFDSIADVVALDHHLATADLVITGEGMLDSQTAMGKVASGVALRAKSHNPDLPVVAICGSVDKHISAQDPVSKALLDASFNNAPFDIVLPSIQKLDKFEDILANAYFNVAQTAYQLAVSLKLGQQLQQKVTR